MTVPDRKPKYAETVCPCCGREAVCLELEIKPSARVVWCCVGHVCADEKEVYDFEKASSLEELN